MDKGIDDLDKRIMDLIAERSKKYIEKLRVEGGQYDPGALMEIRQLINEQNRGPLPNRALEFMFTEMLSSSMNAVNPIKAAYLGPEGTFTGIALHECFGNSVEAVPMNTIPDVFHAVETGQAPYGVVPVENSTEGAVTFTLDELIDTDLFIIAERYVRISYSLLSKAEDLQSIKKIYTHPQTIGQCKVWLRSNLPKAEIIDVSSTSYAAELASQEPESGAIASQAAADIYGLRALVTRIEDSRQNYTRFFVIGRQENKPSGNDKTSIVCAVKDKAGALLHLLEPMSRSGINMTKIESRPDKKKTWAYNFFIDFQGHKDDTLVRKALDEMRDESIFIKILGSYPAGN